MISIARTETLTQQLRRMKARPCPACNGLRAVTRMEAKWWGGSTNGVALHGHQIAKRYVCETCRGEGTVAA